MLAAARISCKKINHLLNKREANRMSEKATYLVVQSNQPYLVDLVSYELELWYLQE